MNVKERAEELRAQLAAKSDNMFSAAAAGVDPKRACEVAVRACIAQPKLFDCSRGTLFSAIAEAARLGLEIGGVLGQAYLVPYKTECALVPGYLGLKELAYRSDRVAMLDADVVRDGDMFRYSRGTSPFLQFEPGDGVDGQITHAFALARVNGEWLIRVLSTGQVNAHRNRFAPGWQRKDSAWQTNWEAMAIKTVLRRLYKLLPLAPDVQRMVQREEFVEREVRIDPLESGATLAGVDLDAAVATCGENDEPPPGWRPRDN